MEGWMIRESQTIKGWMREGEERGELRKAQTVLLKAVRVRLEDPVPNRSGWLSRGRMTCLNWTSGTTQP